MATEGFQLLASLDPYLVPIALLAALAVYVSFSLLLRRAGPAAAGGRRSLPPGPPAWPVIGNLHLLGELPYQSLAKLALRYGPLMSMRLGSILYVVASTPEMARHFLQTLDHTFASRPTIAAASHMLFNSADLAFAPYGPYWRLIRRMCLNHVFHPKRLELFLPIRLEEARGLICGVHRRSDGRRPIVLRPRVQQAANNIISRMALGKKYTELSKSGSAGDMIALIDEIVMLLGMPNVGDFIPYLAWMDLQGWEKRMKAAKKKVQLTMGEIIEERRADIRAQAAGTSPAAPDRREDLLDVLLNAASTEQLTDDNIMAVILDMYLGGTGTISITVEWAVAELLANPSCLKKAQEELDEVVGRERLVEDADMDNLPHLRAVVQETFRLHPVGPLLLPREGMQASSIDGYNLPAGTRVYVNVWAIGRDRGTWEQPMMFQPERFVESEVEEKGQHFQLLPFGAGRRKCVALDLGLMNVRLFLARLLQCFEWRLPEGGQEMREQFGLNVMLASPLTAHALPRLPSSFYT